MPDRSFGHIARLERVVAAELCDRKREPVAPSWHGAAVGWSAAVWSAAEAVGPAELAEAEIERGLAIAQRPVFLCGTHRSGTTLLRDLLDAHPQLIVLPSEGTFYTNLERRLSRLPRDQQVCEMGQEWLRRLANPNSQAPFWLLGRSTFDYSPYVEFGRQLLAWWSVLRDRSQRQRSLWPLTAVALAFGSVCGASDLPSTVTMWAEKTPTNERFLRQLWQEFPSAKVIQMVRRPEAVLASHKAIFPGPWRPSRATAAVYWNLARTYRAAWQHRRNASADRYRLVRYEDLVANPEEIARQLARFLGIGLVATSTLPTVVGMAATRNSSFAEGEARPSANLSRIDRVCLRLAVGGIPACLGYGKCKDRHHDSLGSAL